MKYLDERGLRHLWEKIEELSFSGGGSGEGGGCPTYIDKPYNEYAFDVYNPLDNRTIDERLYLKAGETHTVYKNNVNIGEFTIMEMSQQELVVLEQVLASNGVAGVDALNATYITNVSNWMGLLDNSLFGFILITATLSVGGMQMLTCLHFNNTKADGHDTFAIKGTVRIPFKKYYEPVLLWEGSSNEHTQLMLNDNASKYRFLTLIMYNRNGSTDIYPRTVSSLVVEDTACFEYSGVGGMSITANVKNPYEFSMTNTTNINNMYIERIYGLY